MRILDENTSQSLENILLYLIYSEASELRDGLIDLLNKPLNNHVHISSKNFQKEITVCIYDKENLKGFDQRSMDLIINDK